MFLRVGLAADSVRSLSPPAGRGLGSGAPCPAFGESPSPDALGTVADALASASLAPRTPAEGRLCSPRKPGEVESAALSATLLSVEISERVVLCPSKRSHRYCATFVS